MSEAAIKARGLGKRYRIGQKQSRHEGLRHAISDWFAKPFRSKTASLEEECVWALRDVSFDVPRGEVLGVIGRNGAGKTTLLKILSEITAPTEGEVELRGRVASLLEVGTGFHPELTGRENIYLNGAILGMTRRDIGARFDDIVAFSEVERFLDTPVKRYSSGMYVRLAFAVAAHLDPEILLVDEVLSVGDAGFRKKCLGKMGDVARGGRTVLFLSHQMSAIEGLCDRCMVLDGGRIVSVSDPKAAVLTYLRLTEEVGDVDLADGELKRSGSGDARLTAYHIESAAGETVQSVRSGEDAVFCLSYMASGDKEIRQLTVWWWILSQLGQMLFVDSNDYSDEVFRDPPAQGVIRCRVPRFPLSPGRYCVGAQILVNGVQADFPIDGIGYVTVQQGDFYGTGSAGYIEGNAPFLIKGAWSIA